MRHTEFLLCGVLLLVLSACEDPASSVGLGLLEDGSDPEVHEVQPDVFRENPLNDVTGAVSRVLAGRVEDPLLGAISTTGYIDFTGSFPTTNTAAITGVELRLSRDYVYGDTSTTMELALHEITEDWVATGARADTTLSTGAMVTTFSFMPGDTLIVVPLPDTWIDQNTDRLRSASFEMLFFGFGVRPTSGKAIVGFSQEDSELMLSTTGDNVSYPLGNTLTTVERETAPDTPDTRILLQDGTGPGVRLNFDLEALGNVPLNGARIHVTADTEALAETPPHFVRPTAEMLQLVVVTGPDEPAILIAETAISEDGIFRFRGEGVRIFFQSVLLRQQAYDYLELRAPFLNHSINAVFLHPSSEDTLAPTAFFIVSP